MGLLYYIFFTFLYDNVVSFRIQFLFGSYVVSTYLDTLA